MSLAIKSKDTKLYWALALFGLCILASLLLDEWILSLLPFAMLAASYVFVNPKAVYFVLFASMPFSMEVSLPGGFGTDLPTEPLMILNSGLLILLLIDNFDRLDIRYFTNPITYVLGGILIWILFTSVTSSEPIISIKYFAAKLWYVLPFYLLTVFFYHRHTSQLRTLVKISVIAMFVATSYVMLGHASLGFSFDTINKACQPIFRNHVNYGGLLVLLLPYIVYLFATSKSIVNTLVYPIIIVFFLVAIYLTYTRAAYVCAIATVGVYLILRWRLIRLTTLSALIAATCFVGYMVNKNTYLDYAPNYETTIAHYNFENLMEATYKFEDVSTMERVYRWVAGFRMVGQQPITGFGPGAFYESYRPYTLRSFQTYVSDNPEKSGIHNYYLMVAVEQGIPGLLLFLVLTFLPLFMAQHAYHNLSQYGDRALVMSAAVCLVVIDLLQLMNDLIEADKVGSFYFFSLAVIAILWVKSTSKA